MAATIQFRGAGGEYIVRVQAPNELLCAANWFSTTLSAANLTGVGSRVYPGWPPDTANVGAAAFCTYRWVRSNPDTRTHGVGGAGGRVATLIYEVLVWQQGQTFAGVDSAVTALVSLLDVGTTVTADGTILGAERLSPAEGYYSKEA